MVIRWFNEKDRQDMRDAAEERRVLFALEEEYAVYREASRDVPLTEGMLRILNGEIQFDPNRKIEEEN